MSEFRQSIEVSGRCRIVMLYDSVRQGKILPEYFDQDFWQRQENTEILAKGRGVTYKVQAVDSESAWVLRHYFRGGLFGRIIKQSYFFSSEDKVRSFAEYRITKKLYDLDLPVPEPIAAMYFRTGISYKAAILTRFIPDTQTLSLLLQKPDPIDWKAIADAIHKLHSAGLVHSDLNAHNVLINPDQSVTIIDLDKSGYYPIIQKTTGASFPVMMLTGAHRDNLSRFKRSIDKVSSRPLRQNSDDWNNFIEAYRSFLS